MIKRFIAGIIFFAALLPTAFRAGAVEVPVTALMSGITTTATGTAVTTQQGIKSYHASVTGTGAVTATVIIEGSLDAGTTYVTLCTITLSGTTTDQNGCTSFAAWRLVRSRVTAITGTSATVAVTMGSGL